MEEGPGRTLGTVPCILHLRCLALLACCCTLLVAVLTDRRTLCNTDSLKCYQIIPTPSARSVPVVVRTLSSWRHAAWACQLLRPLFISLVDSDFCAVDSDLRRPLLRINVPRVLHNLDPQVHHIDWRAQAARSTHGWYSLLRSGRGPPVGQVRAPLGIHAGRKKGPRNISSSGRRLVDVNLLFVFLSICVAIAGHCSS